MGKKILISEDESLYIKTLHGLLSEQITNDGGTSRIQNFYRGGYYTTDTVDQKTNRTVKERIDEQLELAIPFLQKNPDSVVQITFESQESFIPNTDNEGVENSLRARLDSGVLSEYRKKYISIYVNEYIKNLKDKGIISSQVKVPKVIHNKKNPVTPWVGTPFCKAGSTEEEQRTTCVRAYRKCKNTTCKSYKDKYLNEQNSTVIITVKKSKKPGPGPTPTPTPPPVDCVTDLKIRVYVPRHACQNAEFFIFANSTLLKNINGGITANLNNADTERGIPKSTCKGESCFDAEVLNPGYGWLPNGDGTYGGYSYGSQNKSGDIGKGRSDTFIVTEEQSKKIVEQGNGKIDIWFIATTSSAHSNIPNIVIEKNGKTVYDGKPNVVQGKLITLNGCGTEVTELGTSSKTPDVSKFITKLKVQKKNIESKIRGGGELSSKQKRNLKNRGTNIDQKGLMLDRASELLDLTKEMTLNLMEMGKYDTKCVSPESSQINDRNSEISNSIKKQVSKNYTELYDLINSEVEGQPTFVRDPENKEFENKFLRSGDMSGDLRTILNPAMNIFDSAYFSTSRGYQPEGKSKSMDTVVRSACRAYNREFRTKS
jgi:hypothetical protein